MLVSKCRPLLAYVLGEATMPKPWEHKVFLLPAVIKGLPEQQKRDEKCVPKDNLNTGHDE